MAVLGSGILMLSANAEGFQKDLKKADRAVTDFHDSVNNAPGVDIGEPISSSVFREELKKADQVVNEFFDRIKSAPEMQVGGAVSSEFLRREISQADRKVVEFYDRIEKSPELKLGRSSSFSVFRDELKRADRAVVDFYNRMQNAPEIKLGDTRSDILGKFRTQRRLEEKELAEYNRRAGRVAEVGEKIGATIGRLAQVGSVFTLMNENASTLEKSIAGVNVAVGVMTTSLQLASKVAAGFKAAMLATGIGAIAVGIGYLVSKMTAARKEEEREVAREREDWQKFLDRIGERTVHDTRPRPVWTERIAPEVFRRERERALRPTAELGIDTDSFVSGLRDAEASIGRTRDEFMLLRLEARRDELGREPLARESDAFRRVTSDIEEARARIARLSAPNLVRDLPAEIERLRTPEQVANDELDRLQRLVDLGGPLGLVEEHARRMIGISADPLVQEFERIEAAATRLSDRTERLRGIDRIFEATGERRSLSEGFAETMTRIDRAAEAARRVAGFTRMESLGITTDVALEARIDRRRGAAFEELAASIGADLEKASPQALLEGTVEAVSAINAARRNATSSDPIERVRAVMERIERIETESRERLEGIGLALRRIRPV